MVPNPLPSRATDARGSSRESIYLTASLYCDGSSSPVKIRNISPTGALIEGATIPLHGSLVQLVRGELIVHAIVIWCQAQRCGLKFSGSVDVQQWRTAPSNTEQLRVDEVVKLVKAGAVPLPVPPLFEMAPDEIADGSATFSNDLRRASALLEDLGAVLATEPAVTARHSGALQNLDIAMQVIAAVEALIGGESDVEILTSKLLGLRRSADQALKRA